MEVHFFGHRIVSIVWLNPKSLGFYRNDLFYIDLTKTNYPGEYDGTMFHFCNEHQLR
jgi:hypothetical protein